VYKRQGLSIKGALGLAMVKMDIYSLEGKLVQSVDFSSTDGMNYKCLPIHLSAGMYQIQNIELGINLPLIVQN
jgi:hypothetical protein